MADYWIKLYMEILDDPKMAVLPDRLWRRVIELFLIAKRENRGGSLPTADRMAWILRLNIDDLKFDLEQLETTGIIRNQEDGWFVVRFAERQGPSSSTERSTQFRQKQQHNQYAGATEMQRPVAQKQKQIQNTEADTEANADAGASARKQKHADLIEARIQQLTRGKSPEDAELIRMRVTAEDNRKNGGA